MACRSVELRARVRYAWWLRSYVAGVVLMAQITGFEPDMEKVRKWIDRGIRTELVPAKK